MLLSGLACVAGCGPSRDAADESGPIRVPVATAPVVRDSITEEVLLVGRLGPPPGGSASLTAPADALVRRVVAQVGAAVRPGDVLIELDAPELTSRAEELKAAADVAEQDARRQKDLLDQGITSRRDFEERQAAAVAARSAADAAERLLERTRVTSPIGGGVQRVLVHPGERVGAGQPLVEVVDVAVLDLVAQAPAAQLARLRVGQAARVQAEGTTEGRPGRVTAIAPAVDTLSNAARVIIRIPDPGAVLRAGVGATARIVVGVREGALLVPDSALVLVGDAMSVFMVGPDSVAHARSVVVGVRAGGRSEVTGALQAGDKVATTGVFGLADGMHVLPTSRNP